MKISGPDSFMSNLFSYSFISATLNDPSYTDRLELLSTSFLFLENYSFNEGFQMYCELCKNLHE